MKEMTFQARCELCHRLDQPCRHHHLIPQRLLAILPKNSYLRWFRQMIIICGKCNGYIHPENHLYKRVNYLEEQLGLRQTDFTKRVEIEQEIELEPQEAEDG